MEYDEMIEWAPGSKPCSQSQSRDTRLRLGRRPTAYYAIHDPFSDLSFLPVNVLLEDHDMVQFGRECNKTEGERALRQDFTVKYYPADYQYRGVPTI